MTTAICPSPTWSRSCPTRRCSGRPRIPCRSCPRPRRPVSNRSSDCNEQAALLLSFEVDWAEYFEGVLESRDGIDPRVVANWVTGEFSAELRKQGDIPLAEAKVDPASLATLIGLVNDRKISHGAGKTVLESMVAEGADPDAVVAEKGLEQISDSGELEKIVIQAIEDNPKPVEQVRSGNEKAIGALVGAVMKDAEGPCRRRRSHPPAPRAPRPRLIRFSVLAPGKDHAEAPHDLFPAHLAGLVDRPDPQGVLAGAEAGDRDLR